MNLCFGKNNDGVFGFVDSDYAKDINNRRSISGYVFTLGGCAISWIVVYGCAFNDRSRIYGCYGRF